MNNYSITQIQEGLAFASVSDLVFHLDLRPADVLKVRKRGISMLDHYMVYLGYSTEDQEHLFSANMTGGVQVLREADVLRFSHRYGLTEVRYFKGSSLQQSLARERAQSMIGKPYRLAGFNCENYANYVQTGKSRSRQTQNAGIALLGTGAALAIGGTAAEKKKTRNAGYVIGGLGVLALLLEAFSGPD